MTHLQGTRSVNIVRALYSNAEANPQQTAIIIAAGRDKQGQRQYDHFSFEALVQQANQLARGFHEIGITRGERTVLMVKPSFEFFSLMFAMLKSGIVPVLIDPGMGLSHLKTCLAEAEPTAFIGIPKAHAARLALGWAKDSLKTHVTVGPKLGWGGHSLDQVLAMGQNNPIDGVADTQADEVAALLFTSGSTGVPKGVIYQHRNFQAQIDRLRERFQIQPGEIDLATFPPFALFDPALGMTSIIPEMDPTRPAEVNPESIFDAIERFQVTHMFGSPALLNRISRAGVEQERYFPSLKRVLSAGAPVPYQTLERMQKMLPPEAQIYTPYGATECLPVSVTSGQQILEQTQFQTAQGLGICIGEPVPGVQVEIIPINDEAISDWDSVTPLPEGEWGEIVVAGENVTSAYFNRPESTALAKIQDGDQVRHRMGDLGYFDDQGRLWFCGRKAHRVITEQQTFFTVPCEAIFNTHPDVYRTALVGAKSGGKTVPVICIELESEAQLPPDQVRLDLLELAARYPHTQPIRIFLIHPALPVDIRHNSKIFREKLAVWATEQLAKRQQAIQNPLTNISRQIFKRLKGRSS